MLIMIVHSSVSVIPYNVISDVTSIREIEGTHIPLPARSNRERAEMIKDFISKAQEDPQQIWLLVANEDLCDSLKLEDNNQIDVVLYSHFDNNSRPAVSVWKNGIGDEGISYEEFLETLPAYSCIPQPPLEKPKYFTQTQRG
ncbi:MAG: hypothetical protein AB1489_18510 [Acidobacteriota bacterium]